MNKRLLTTLLPLLAFIMTVGVLHQAWAAKTTQLMTKEELQGIISNADTYVLDVRTGRDWNSSEFKIQGAHRADPKEFNTWESKFPKSGTLVLYCA